METAVRAAMLGTLGILGGCGAGGSGGSGGTTGATGLTGSLAVVSHSPAHNATEVPVDVRVRVRLDAAVVRESLGYSDTGLFAGGASVPGSFVLEEGGATLVFVPQSDLREQTDYVFQLSPLTCDSSGRILDQPLAVAFRTIDQQPPAVSWASVSAGQTGVQQASPILIRFDEDLLASSASPSNVHFRDEYGTLVATETEVNGPELSVSPLVNFAGSRHYTLEIRGGPGGVSDLAGNPLSGGWSVDFETTPDTWGPTIVSARPTGTDTSPLAHVRIGFSESVEPASVEPSSIVLVDEFASIVPFDVVASADQRTLRLAPLASLVPGRTYSVTVLGGTGALTDITGNVVQLGRTVGFTTGADVTPPTITTTHPQDNATGVSLNTVAKVTLDEPVDPQSVTDRTVELYEGTRRITVTTVLEAGDTVINVQPGALLAKGRQHRLIVRGGFDGVLDAAGNPLPSDLTVTFNTTNDGTLPSVMLLPPDGTSSVPTTVRLTALFDGPMDPGSIDDTTVRVTGPGGTVVPGTLLVERSDRVVHFQPGMPWNPGDRYTLTVLGGPQGVREVSGNHLAQDATSDFRIQPVADTVAPTIEITVNATDETRNKDLSLPPWGFEIDVSAFDPQHFSLDMTTVQVTLSGPGVVPGTEAIFAAASVDDSSLHYELPQTWELEPGEYRLSARVSDLSGNTGRSNELRFRVEQTDNDTLPFERTQVMWVRFDLDRDGNGRPDLDDDLLLLGLMTPGDPAGTNERMREVMRDGVLASCNDAFGRSASGTPLGSRAVPIRLTHRRPLGLSHSSIACAGMDPEGQPTRSFGSSSTGTLGRAFFDYRNGNTFDENIASNPGLGVFPAEMFFFEVGIHLSVYPGFTTAFARKFLEICPDMGGTPAGSDPLDATVLSSSFDYLTATSAERQRYDEVFGAIDDWATVIVTILAHEIGHAVGLVASGENPLGLHGDSSLHNEFTSAESIMSPALGYDSMVFMEFAYRDLNIAYLRQRLLMK